MVVTWRKLSGNHALYTGAPRPDHRQGGPSSSSSSSSNATRKKKIGTSSDGTADNSSSTEEVDSGLEEKAAMAAEMAETDAIAMIESLLVLGQREAAVSHALLYRQWFLALMISSTCEPALYQSVVSQFANQNIVPASTLHSLLLLYSNQGHRGFGLGGTIDPRTDLRLNSMPGTATADDGHVDDLTSFKRSWRRESCGIIIK